MGIWKLLSAECCLETKKRRDVNYCMTSWRTPTKLDRFIANRKPRCACDPRGKHARFARRDYKPRGSAPSFARNNWGLKWITLYWGPFWRMLVEGLDEGVSKDVIERRTSTGSDATILKNLTSSVYRQLILFFFSFAVYTRERRLPPMSQKAFNRWHLTMTLLRNPCLIKYRKRIGISRATSVSLRSIRSDLSDLLVPAWL